MLGEWKVKSVECRQQYMHVGVSVCVCVCVRACVLNYEVTEWVLFVCLCD